MKHTLSLIAAAATALMLVACDRRDDQTASQSADTTVASADTAAERARDDAAAAGHRVEGAADSAANRVEGAAESAGAKIEAAGEKMADKVNDAAITASVNAALARDPGLSALGINVDTVNGTVSLKGAAPDQAARTRATELASSVDGVTSVDNQLEVRG